LTFFVAFFFEGLDAFFAGFFLAFGFSSAALMTSSTVSAKMNFMDLRI